MNTEIKMETPSNETIQMLKITTVVELMRNKTKESKLRSKRETRRSLSIVAKPQNLTNDAPSTILMRNFYRFPRTTTTTTEEPLITSQINNNPILNYDQNENINVFETKSLPVPHPFSFLQLPISAYNDTIATEVDNLNISPQLPNYIIKRIKTSSKIDNPIISTTSPNTWKIKKQREILKKPNAPLLKDATNATYINILDHRKDLLKEIERQTVPGYPADIPPYNPDIIPYVHVPDYSDQREESLDKNDGQISRTKFKDYENQDFIDPTSSVDNTNEAEAVKGTTDKPKVSAQTPYVDIQDYRPVKDAYEFDKTEEIPVHETQESEDTSQKQLSQETQTPKESSAEDKRPFSFKELFKELNLPYNEDDFNETKEEEEEEKEELNENDKGDNVEGNYSDKYKNESQESSSSSEIYSSGENFNDNNNEREKSTEVGDDDHTNEDAKLIRITDEEFKYGDKDFFKPFFENSREISSHEYYSNDNDNEKKENRKREIPNRRGIFDNKYTSRLKDKRNKLRTYSDILSKTKKKKKHGKRI
ncbi:myb-like protein X [Leptopilina boulardi]|uniref:myb-like protein X n=1 Tax=Leptopilina boulardi TaxID=63433 RepID=UPI0021F67D55|nr:myb-like protein X [Leptopilina boulardi]